MNGLTPPFNYDYWSLGTDGSIKTDPEDTVSPQGDEFRFSAVELITPTFYWGQSAVAFEQLERALGIIQQEFQAFMNRSCGMHIHVGNGQW